jgi:hypothetical protein
MMTAGLGHNKTRRQRSAEFYVPPGPLFNPFFAQVPFEKGA